MDPQTLLSQQPEPPVQSTITTPPQKENNLNKILIAVVGVLAVVTLAVGGYYFLSNQQTKQQAVIAPTQSPTPLRQGSEGQTPSSKPDQFAGWKRYENSELGYSVKYPVNLSVDTSSVEAPYNRISINVPTSDFTIEFFDNLNNLSAKDFFQDRYNKQLQSGGPPPQEPKTSKNININGNDAYQVETFAFDGNKRITYLTKNNKAVVITYYIFNTDPSFDRQNVKLSDQILSTFKFID